MKAWIIDSFNGIEHARLADVSDPNPASGEVVLRVKYAALNPADAYLAQGQYPAKPPLPHILGRDGVGTIAAVGADVRDVKAGEKRAILCGDVGVSRWGTSAELVAVPNQSLVSISNGWTPEEASWATLVISRRWALGHRSTKSSTSIRSRPPSLGWPAERWAKFY